jgi:Na+-translocating ferredoxin:NAD+ oxidoreductase RnfD subunit
MVVARVFAVIIAKQLYGGLGHNPFNPAMIGYVVLLISFPVQMTSWLPPHERLRPRFRALWMPCTLSLPAIRHSAI